MPHRRALGRTGWQESQRGTCTVWARVEGPEGETQPCAVPVLIVTMRIVVMMMVMVMMIVTQPSALSLL